MEAREKFNKRAFVSAGMIISFFGLPFSGYMNHVLGFEDMFRERHIWMSVHNMLGLFFVIFSACHIKLNWKPLAGYFKMIKVLIFRREVVYAATLIILFLGLAVFHAAHAGLR